LPVEKANKAKWRLVHDRGQLMM